MKRLLLCIIVIAAVISSVSFAQARSSNAFVALDFKLSGLDQKTYSLSEYKGKSDVLLFFWTTWCPFCRGEIRRLSARSSEMAKDGIVVLAINVGEPRGKVERYINAHSIKLPVLLDEDTMLSDIYGIMGVPTFLLVDKNGMVVFSDNRFPDNYKGILPKD